ncbi:unnamed protein product [Haemonchus placei]|uniref:PNP_UDP_1 domain-containing protein n=1 Tax=Haemonchus placei TaxID=6290 RepID=A0A0N4WVG9_HAEPC|nr:unnamed protein product [Haemonchus placei]
MFSMEDMFKFQSGHIFLTTTGEEANKGHIVSRCYFRSSVMVEAGICAIRAISPISVKKSMKFDISLRKYSEKFGNIRALALEALA